MIEKRPRLALIITLMLFGTIGTISRFVDLPSAFMSCARALISTVVIVSYIYMSGRRPDFDAIRANALRIFLAGVCMSLNWVLMFEAFRLTSVAIASLLYYMQPIFLMLCAPVCFGERLSIKKTMCIVTAFLGMVLVTGVLSPSVLSGGTSATVSAAPGHIKGALFAIMAAVLYTANVVINKKFKRDINPIDSTCSQIFIAGMVLLPYVWMTTDVSSLSFNARSILLLLLLSVVHTGIAYIVYYTSSRLLEAQTIAILGYIDPVESVLLSAFLLKEPLSVRTIIGAVLILGSTSIGSKD